MSQLLLNFLDLHGCAARREVLYLSPRTVTRALACVQELLKKELQPLTRIDEVAHALKATYSILSSHLRHRALQTDSIELAAKIARAQKESETELAFNVCEWSPARVHLYTLFGGRVDSDNLYISRWDARCVVAEVTAFSKRRFNRAVSVVASFAGDTSEAQASSERATMEYLKGDGSLPLTHRGPRVCVDTNVGESVSVRFWISPHVSGLINQMRGGGEVGGKAYAEMQKRCADRVPSEEESKLHCAAFFTAFRRWERDGRPQY
jgi:hypothetical protein